MALGETQPLGAPRPRSSWSHSSMWITGAVALLALLATCVLTLGIAAIIWVPIVFIGAVGMCFVWAARRRRQVYQGRDSDERLDPRHGPRSWRSDEIIDDRLPEP